MFVDNFWLRMQKYNFFLNYEKKKKKKYLREHFSACLRVWVLLFESCLSIQEQLSRLINSLCNPFKIRTLYHSAKIYSIHLVKLLNAISNRFFRFNGTKNIDKCKFLGNFFQKMIYSFSNYFPTIRINMELSLAKW